MSWESTNKMLDEAGGGGVYLNLKDGDPPVIGTFHGEPHAAKRFWNGKTYEPYTKEHLDADKDASNQVEINFLPKGSAEMRILQGGLSLGIALRDAHKIYGLDGVYRVERTGGGRDTRFSILIMPQEESPSDIPPLHDLEGKASSTVSAGGDPSDLPF